MNKLSAGLMVFTEKVLTRRRVRHYIKKERQKAKNPVVDWVEAFLWAAVVVLLINQYLFQAYQIPSGSMKDTLLIKDRIFVNKMIYGPELVPGMFKVPGLKTPKRGDVIIFENPQYLSRGPVFDVLQRVIYMLTLSMVDIDKDEQGRPKAHFLIKRQVLEDGDIYRQDRGNLEIRPRGEASFIPEADFKKKTGLNYGNKRLIPLSDYPVFRAYGEAYALNSRRLPIPDALRKEASKIETIAHKDPLEMDMWRQKALYAIQPENTSAGAHWCAAAVTGSWIPEGWVLPMGDNRDNSNDGRYFGPIPKYKVLGQAMFKYWPLSRMGLIH